MLVSPVISDFGNKYKQLIGSDTGTENVLALPSVDGVTNIGIRMEDYALTKSLDNGIVIIVVCDGHGAVELTPTRFVGGYETAKFVTNFLVDDLSSKLSDKGSMSSAQRREIVPILLADSFAEAQRRLMDEFEKGAERAYFVTVPTTFQPTEEVPLPVDSSANIRRVSLLPEAANDEMYKARTILRRKELEMGLIDGFHFSEIHQAEKESKVGPQTSSDNNRLPSRIITDKILLPVPEPINPTNPIFVAFYTNAQESMLVELDFGCTCTAALLFPHTTVDNGSDTTTRQSEGSSGFDNTAESSNSGAFELYVAHVGDSDAYILPSSHLLPSNSNSNNVDGFEISKSSHATAPSIGPLDLRTNNDETIFGVESQPVSQRTAPIRVCANHTVKNEAEVLRMSKYGVIAKPPYFSIVDPLPIARARAIMPSRSFGHSIFQHYGLIAEPHICIDTVYPGETLAVGTDGLWDERWNAATVISQLMHSVATATLPTQTTTGKMNDTDLMDVDQDEISEHQIPQVQMNSKRLGAVGREVLHLLKEELPSQDNIAFVLAYNNSNNTIDEPAGFQSEQ